MRSGSTSTGSYMATVAAQPVFKLLGVRGLGVSDDYKNATMPPVNQGLMDGELAWRATRRRPYRRAECKVLHWVG